MHDLMEKMDKLGRAGGKDDCSAVMDEVEKLKKEIAKLKQDLMNMLLALENQLNAKAENQALLDLEGRTDELLLSYNSSETGIHRARTYQEIGR